MNLIFKKSIFWFRRASEQGSKFAERAVRELQDALESLKSEIQTIKKSAAICSLFLLYKLRLKIKIFF